MTPKEYKEMHKRGQYLTVGRLKEYLDQYPDDALVVSQRIEDVYYEKHGWQTLKKPNPMFKGFDSEYSAVWSPVLYKDDKECFYLDLHY